VEGEDEESMVTTAERGAEVGGLEQGVGSPGLRKDTTACSAFLTGMASTRWTSAACSGCWKECTVNCASGLVGPDGARRMRRAVRGYATTVTRGLSPEQESC
jgi:hypothetical protein